MKDISLENITVNFSERTVISGLTEIFTEGSKTAVMGPSGAGKTTLINVILGLVKPSAGVVTLGEEIHFSCVFQEDRLFEDFTAAENIRAVLKNVALEDIDEGLKRLGLYEDRAKRVSEFSGGMRRRAAILRAMLAKSDAVILDEPFKGLDDEIKKEVTEYIRDTLGKRTLILVTHDENEAQSLCDRVVRVTMK